MTCPRSLEWIQSCCLVAKSCPTLCNPTDYSTPGFLVLHHLLEFAHKLMVIESVMPFNHLIICHPFSSCPQSFPALGSFPMSPLFVSGGQVLELQLQHQSFQWIFRVDFLQDWLVWSPRFPRDSQESSPASQFESIHSALNLLYGPTVTSVHDYRKNHSMNGPQNICPHPNPWYLEMWLYLEIVCRCN